MELGTPVQIEDKIKCIHDCAGVGDFLGMMKGLWSLGEEREPVFYDNVFEMFRGANRVCDEGGNRLGAGVLSHLEEFLNVVGWKRFNDSEYVRNVFCGSKEYLEYKKVI